MKNIAVLALLGLLTKTETINAISLHRLENLNVCISELHEDTENLLGLDSEISILEDPPKTEAKSGEGDPIPGKKEVNVSDYLR